MMAEAPIENCVSDACKAWAVKAEMLRMVFGEKIAVHGLDLAIRPGLIFGLLGLNGAGKSTTIKCLTGQVRPTSGRLAMLGEPFDDRAYWIKRRIGVLPENLALFDQLYADEFLAFQGRIFGLPSVLAETRAGELLGALGLAETKETLGRFSTGMRKKVAIAAALIHQPDLIFLDEPFESLDPVSVATVKGWLRTAASRGRTIFITSHALDMVERFCQDCAILHEGRLVWSGTLPAVSGEQAQFFFKDRTFDSLEALFLEVTGQECQRIDWI